MAGLGNEHWCEIPFLWMEVRKGRISVMPCLQGMPIILVSYVPGNPLQNRQMMITEPSCSVFFRSFCPRSHGPSALRYLYLPEVQHCPPTEPQSCRSRSCIPDPWVSRPGCWADQPARNLRSLPCGREQWTLETVREKKRERNNSWQSVKDI